MEVDSRESVMSTGVTVHKDITMTEPSKDRLILPHGGYENLKSVQNALIIYDATREFCDLYIPGASRTQDQMVQRRGVASRTSPKEVRLRQRPRKSNLT